MFVCGKRTQTELSERPARLVCCGPKSNKLDGHGRNHGVSRDPGAHGYICCGGRTDGGAIRFVTECEARNGFLSRGDERIALAWIAQEELTKMRRVPSSIPIALLASSVVVCEVFCLEAYAWESDCSVPTFGIRPFAFFAAKKRKPTSIVFGGVRLGITCD